MNQSELKLSYSEGNKWIDFGMIEIVKRFDLKPKKSLPNFHSYCFVKKNTNRYFRKHLGFSYSKSSNDMLHYYKIIITDFKKLFLFKMKYGL